MEYEGSLTYSQDQFTANDPQPKESSTKTPNRVV